MRQRTNNSAYMHSRHSRHCSSSERRLASYVLALRHCPRATERAPATTGHATCSLKVDLATTHCRRRYQSITCSTGRSSKDNLIYPRLHFPSATADETLPERAVAARDRTYQNGVQESDDVQRLLGGSPERTEDEPMALSGSSSSHTHPEKPEQQVKAGCLS